MLHNRLDEFKSNLMIRKKTRFDLKKFQDKFVFNIKKMIY